MMGLLQIKTIINFSLGEKKSGYDSKHAMAIFRNDECYGRR